MFYSLFCTASNNLGKGCLLAGYPFIARVGLMTFIYSKIKKSSHLVKSFKFNTRSSGLPFPYLNTGMNIKNVTRRGHLRALPNIHNFKRFRSIWITVKSRWYVPYSYYNFFILFYFSFRFIDCLQSAVCWFPTISKYLWCSRDLVQRAHRWTCLAQPRADSYLQPFWSQDYRRRLRPLDHRETLKLLLFRYLLRWDFSYMPIRQILMLNVVLKYLGLLIHYLWMPRCRSHANIQQFNKNELKLWLTPMID